jgi:hypothetical protein
MMVAMAKKIKNLDLKTNVGNIVRCVLRRYFAYALVIVMAVLMVQLVVLPSVGSGGVKRSSKRYTASERATANNHTHTSTNKTDDTSAAAMTTQLNDTFSFAN